MTGPRFEFDGRFTLSDLVSVVLVLLAIGGFAWRQSSWETKHDVVQNQQTDTLARVGAEAQASADWIKLEVERQKAFPLHKHSDGEMFFPDGHVEKMK